MIRINTGLESVTPRECTATQASKMLTAYNIKNHVDVDRSLVVEGTRWDVILDDDTIVSILSSVDRRDAESAIYNLLEGEEVVIFTTKSILSQREIDAERNGY